MLFKNNQTQPPLILPCVPQLYLEASWYRLRSRHVWSAGSSPRHPGRRWVTPFFRLSFLLCFDRKVCQLTCSFQRRFRFFRGQGLQLFHPAHEENESKLPTWRGYGHSFCQHALSNSGESASTRSAHKTTVSINNSGCLFWPWYPRLLAQILDSELFELMHQNGDYTHFYFCYRWFLLDFKRGKK